MCINYTYICIYIPDSIYNGAGSATVSLMSVSAPTVAGGVVATLQSDGAAGLGASGTAALVTVGSTIGGAVGYIFGG